MFLDEAAKLAGLSAALFGWTPEEFWRATPAEFAGIVRALSPQSEAAPDAATLKTLMEQFPDG